LKNFFEHPLIQTNKYFTDENGTKLTPYQAVDKLIALYGIKIVIRQLIKAIMKKVLANRHKNK
jgi:hypothetical protein